MTLLSCFTFTHWRRKRQPTPVFLPGESLGWRSLVGCRLWGRTESDTTEATWRQQQQVFVSLVAVSGGYSLEQCTGFSLRWLLLWWSTGSRAHGFSTGAPEHGLTSCSPWTQLPLLHVGSSQTRDQTSVSCMARQILNYWTTQEVHTSMFNSPFWILATFPIFPLRPGAGVITALL